MSKVAAYLKSVLRSQGIVKFSTCSHPVAIARLHAPDCILDDGMVRAILYLEILSIASNTLTTIQVYAPGYSYLLTMRRSQSNKQPSLSAPRQQVEILEQGAEIASYASQVMQALANMTEWGLCRTAIAESNLVTLAWVTRLRSSVANSEAASLSVLRALAT